MRKKNTDDDESTQLAARGDYASAIIALVREKNGGVSFVELEELLRPFMTTQGDIAVYLPEYANIIMWSGMSLAFRTAVHDALETGLIEYRPTSILVYMVDGKMLNYPLVKSARQYKKPHWLPVAFRLKG